MSTKIELRYNRFVKEYLKDQNGTRAAIAAGYSKNGAEVVASRLLRNAKIIAKLAEEREKLNKKLDVSIERVTLELARLAFLDPKNFFREDGTAKPITELDEDSARAIAGFEVEEVFTGRGENRSLFGQIKKFKLADKGQNLERLGKHLQMFPSPPQELKVTDGNADSSERLIQLLRAAARRAGQASDME